MKSVRGSILLVGASARTLTEVTEALASLGETRVTSPREALAALERCPADVVVMADADGGDAFLRRVATLRPSSTRILIAETNGHDDDAYVRVPASVDAVTLRTLCTMALRAAAAEGTVRELADENARLRDTGSEVMADLSLDGDGLVTYEGMLTRSRSMRRVLNLLRTIEATDTTVLIQGETGTGKELAAQAIHARSRRRAARFAAVNLGAISDPLRESELFGHVRGAFTGATDSRSGLFADANGGTVFLDEVGDASPGLQVALLRVLEEGTITPVGADRPRRVDVRIISGTNRDLEEQVRRGQFRRDLYYRLHVFPIELPPLRDRPEDVFPLANHFLVRAATTLGKPPPGISREARTALEAHGWEGNVRELRNVIERAAIMCRGALVIAADLPLAAAGARSSADGGATIAIPAGGAHLLQLERQIFVKTLALADGNQSQAARMLGLCESTFRFRLSKLGLGQRRLEDVSQPAAKSQRAANS
jgi:DNA-binding NtrC family response regulator